MRLFIVTAALVGVGAALFTRGHADEKNAPPQTGKQQIGETKGIRFNAERFIKDHDKNNDGKLSKDELPAHIQESFGEVDANKDGFVSTEELQAHADRLARQRPQMVEVVFYAIDIKEPEVNQVEELQKAYDILRKLDKDKNGKIDGGELTKFREARLKDRCEGMVKFMDKNNDGKIAKDEARGLWADHFDELDTNKDGFIDKAEIEKALTAAISSKEEERERLEKRQPQQPDK